MDNNNLSQRLYFYVNKYEFDELINQRNSLFKENEELRNKLLLLTNESIETNIRIKQKDIEIDELRKENILLKEKIFILENDKLTMQNEIKELKHEIKELKNKNEYNKFKICIQDINSLFELEKNISFSQKTKDNLKKLRKQRVEISHYIFDDDENNIKLCKINVAYYKIKNINNECKLLFENKFGTDFLLNLIQFLNTKIINTNFNQDEFEEANDWWID